MPDRIPIPRGFHSYSSRNNHNNIHAERDFDISHLYLPESSEDDIDSDSDSDYFPPCRRQSRQRSISCPVCKTVHAFCPPKNDSVSEENRYSHDARVIYASFGCPICLEDPAGPPMVVLTCGHAVCQDDFRLLGGMTTNAQADAQVRQRANAESQQNRQHLREQRQQLRAQRRVQRSLANTNGDDIDNDSEDEGLDRQVRNFFSDDPVPMHMMMAFAATLDEFYSLDDSDDDDDDDNDNTRPTTRSESAQNGSNNNGSMTRGATRDSRRNSTNGSNRARSRFSHHLTIRPPRTFHQFLIGSSSSEEDDDDDDDDYDSDDAREVDLAEFRYNLMQYHPCNESEYEPPDYAGFPRIGQWMLVPDGMHGNSLDRLYLVYYCESDSYGYGENIRAIRRCSSGTRLIPNGKHGIYIHTPPRNDTDADLWDVFYVKNDKPDGRNNRSRRGRNASSANTAQDTYEPILKYVISKKASLVSDGNGGLWALYPEVFVPDSVRRSSTAVNSSGGSINNSDNNPRSVRKFKLVHYTHRRKDGLLVGDETYFAPTKMFMDKSGGVLLLTRDSVARDSCSSLWHISHYNNQTLLHGGISQGTRVVGDSNGTSVFLLSSIGSLQSNLKRVMIERHPSTGSIQSRTCFSYDLDVPVEGIKHIVDRNDNLEQLYMHCRWPARASDSPCWRVCLVSPQTAAIANSDRPRSVSESSTAQAAQREVNIEPVGFDCPRNSRIVSDRANGVWVWKKPWQPRSINPGDRSFFHLCGNGEDEWYSPILFPSETQLAAFR